MPLTYLAPLSNCSARLAFSTEKAEFGNMVDMDQRHHTHETSHCKVFDFTQADPTSSFNREYERYEPDEVV